jgi:hypothetical protein
MRILEQGFFLSRMTVFTRPPEAMEAVLLTKRRGDVAIATAEARKTAGSTHAGHRGKKQNLRSIVFVPTPTTS